MTFLPKISSNSCKLHENMTSIDQVIIISMQWLKTLQKRQLYVYVNYIKMLHSFQIEWKIRFPFIFSVNILIITPKGGRQKITFSIKCNTWIRANATLGIRSRATPNFRSIATFPLLPSLKMIAAAAAAHTSSTL